MLKKYFSSREYDLLSSVLVIPFFSDDNKLFSFLLVSEEKSIDSSEFDNIVQQKPSFYPVFREHILYFYRNVNLKHDNAVFLPADQAFKQIEDLMGKNQNYSNFFAAVFDAGGFFSFLDKNFDLGLHSSFYNILINLFSSFASDAGKVFILDKYRICILKDAPSLNDKDIMAHQIIFVLKSLIPVKVDNIAGLSTFISVFHLPADNVILKDFINA